MQYKRKRLVVDNCAATATELKLDYYVMAKTWREVNGKQDSGLSKPLRATPTQNPAARNEMNCLVLISAVR
jgi:hypothetical protein